MRVTTASKINLFLQVKDLREDGFHEIETIYHSVGLVDEIRITESPASTTELLTEAAPELVADLPSVTDNLVHRAVELLREETGRRDGVSIEMLKRIPIAAGLAGGSGNAAGILLALDAFWKLGLPLEELARIGSVLGSDVPYCLHGGTMRARGRGEDLEPLRRFSAWFVLGIASRGVSTAAVYSAWDQTKRSAEQERSALERSAEQERSALERSAEQERTAGSGEMIDAIASGDVEGVASRLHNDLEGPVLELRPELARSKEALERAGASGALVSGSGPTIFGLCSSRAEATEVADRVRDRFDRVEVVPSVPRCVELEGG